LLASVFQRGIRRKMQFVLTNDAAALNDFFDRVERAFSDRELSCELFFSLRLALEELLTNIIKYGYDDASEHMIRVDISAGPEGGANVRIADDGHPFDPLTQAKKTEIADSLEDQQIGGLGIFLVKEMARNLRYRRENNQNIVEFWIGEDAL